MSCPLATCIVVGLSCGCATHSPTPPTPGSSTSNMPMVSGEILWTYETGAEVYG